MPGGGAGIGLLALTARTLRQTEFIALRKLAGAERTELNRALLSVDRFVRRDSPLPVDAGIRAQLLERFGMFGIRMSIAVLAAGVTDSTGLAAELLERSGLVALRNVIDQQFAQRPTCLRRIPPWSPCADSCRRIRCRRPRTSLPTSTRC